MTIWLFTPRPTWTIAAFEVSRLDLRMAATHTAYKDAPRSSQHEHMYMHDSYVYNDDKRCHHLSSFPTQIRALSVNGLPF
jgi:hypothetical protein